MLVECPDFQVFRTAHQIYSMCCFVRCDIRYHNHAFHRWFCDVHQNVDAGNDLWKTFLLEYWLFTLNDLCRFVGWSTYIAAALDSNDTSDPESFKGN